MSIPDYQRLMRPYLELLAEGKGRRHGNAVELLADHFNLSDEDRAEMLPSGQEPRFRNRAGWARTYLKKAGLLIYPERGHSEITERGREFLQAHQGPIFNNDLRAFESFQDFYASTSNGSGEDLSSASEDADQTPDERIRTLHSQLNAALASDLLEQVLAASPAFFERMLVGLLIAMGYGGTAEDAGRSLGQSRDGGVDGVIDQDPLGVDQIYLQAKRYAPGNSVGPGAIQAFAGALQMKQASKGIFVTTSTFTSGAKDAASRLGSRIVLIDGEMLGRLMIRYEIGCREEATLVLRRIDEDFFESI